MQLRPLIVGRSMLGRAYRYGREGLRDLPRLIAHTCVLMRLWIHFAMR